MGTIRLAALMATAVAAVACGGHRSSTRAIPGETAVVYFSNGSTEQAAVYAVSGGESRRIGTVFAGQLAKLRVPASMVARGSVNILARLLARNELPQSGSIAIGPGTAHEVTLMPDGRTIMVLPGAPDR